MKRKEPKPCAYRGCKTMAKWKYCVKHSNTVFTERTIAKYKHPQEPKREPMHVVMARFCKVEGRPQADMSPSHFTAKHSRKEANS